MVFTSVTGHLSDAIRRQPQAVERASIREKLLLNARVVKRVGGQAENGG